MRTTLATIPNAVSYLYADQAQVAAWHTRLASLPNQGIRVGLVWAGNPRTHSPELMAVDRRRSVAPELLAPLFDLPGLHFFSLQKDGTAAPADFPLTDFMNEMEDFADTAALIANLDLVISVDTSVAHLAAALGKPVWLLNRFDTCWRWLLEREGSPWYPTLRLFRQPQPGDWHTVVEKVVEELRCFDQSGMETNRSGTIDRTTQPQARSGGTFPAELPQAECNQLVALFKAGRHAELESRTRLLIEQYPSSGFAWKVLGASLSAQGKDRDALPALRKAAELQPDDAEAHYNLGTVLKVLGQLDDAVESFRHALKIKPDYAEAHSNLGIVLNDLGQVDDAVASYRRALEINPNIAEAHNNLGNVLKDLRQHDNAVTSYRRALEIKPDYAEAHFNLGNILKDLGQLDDAVASYRQALKIKPDYPDAHGNLAIALLIQGNLTEGWKEFEWRWSTPQMIPSLRNFAQPQWHGEAAEGRILLIHAEQGFGDTLQFCRYAPLASSRGLRVILEVPKPLFRLLRSLPGVDLMVESGEKLPAFDLHCPMLSMPLAMGTTLETIPKAASYLHADITQVAAWRTRLASLPNQGIQIGLVWAGNPRSHAPELAAVDRRRSVAPELLAPLFDLPGFHFFSLQKDGTAAPKNFPLTDFMDEMEDFADTAALIANLDLVISVDTAVAHLAAALGKPVWLLNRFDICWRWLLEREDSPWYPSLRLFRQPKPGDWQTVIEQVVEELRCFNHSTTDRATPSRVSK